MVVLEHLFLWFNGKKYHEKKEQGLWHCDSPTIQVYLGKLSSSNKNKTTGVSKYTIKSSNSKRIGGKNHTSKA